MPRRPTSFRRLLNRQALTFSRFACSVAQIASIRMDILQTHKSKYQKGTPINFKGNEISKRTLEEQSDLSESSEEEGSELI